jgi:hypothetical protein
MGVARAAPSAATSSALSAVTTSGFRLLRGRRRVLAWPVRHGTMGTEAVAAMLAWRDSGGFSVDASVRLAARDRQGVERLARYCARPSFSSARLDRLSAETLAYRLKKPLPMSAPALPSRRWSCWRAWRH